jgi:hypothetical protein
MTFIWRRRRVAAGLLFCGLIASGCGKDDRSVAWTIESGDCPKDSSSSIVRGCKVVAAKAETFLTPDTNLKLTLPDGTTVEVTPDEAINFDGKGVVWHGSIAGANFSEVTFSTVGKAIVGTIAFNGRMFRLRTLLDGVKFIEELDPASFPTDAAAGGEPVDQPEFEPPTASCTPGTDDCEPVAAQCTAEDPNRIDVLVLYTDKALKALQGVDALNAWILLQVFQTNRSYQRSHLTQQIRLVSVVPTAYQELSNYWSHRDLIENADPQMDAHALRNVTNADVVVLLTQAESAGGAGYADTFAAENLPGASFITSFEPYAFAVVDALGFETTDLTFAHELGHLMGAEHDESSSSSTKGVIPDQSHGYFDAPDGSACKFMTIMARRNAETQTTAGNCLDCDRLVMWSNTDEDTKQCGRPVGSTTANNRDSLKLTAPYISKFRCATTPPGDVWMKDTWNDSGTEPDLGQASADMWKSPYIWVRNSQDVGPSYPAQHLHQNAVPGQVNYVYVKLQNDGEQAEGTLQIWAADAATALLWPGSFTKVGSVAVPTFPGHSTRIVEVPWTPAGDGPFSLIAKWVSEADPVAVPEPANPDQLARGSNNVIWRSLNVITFDPSVDEASGTLVVRNPERIQTNARIVIRPSDANPNHSFFRSGSVIVQLDDGLLRAWGRTRYQGRGFQRVGRQLLITDPAGALLDVLELDPGAQNRMRMVFRLPREGRRKGRYHVDVIQSEFGDGPARHARQVGGASYEIQVIAQH